LNNQAQHGIEKSPLISAIIVNYRCWDKLQPCLVSLLESVSDINAIALEIIVVDNDSNDSQLPLFIEQFPTVTFIKNGGNYGFANGCNTGAAAARGEFLFFVNPDTEVPCNVLPKLQKAIDNLPPFSIVAPQKSNNKGKYERIERFFPRWYTLTGIGKSLHRICNKKQIKKRFTEKNELAYPDWVSGSAVFIRHHEFKELQGWNEKFWMYSEDVDLCMRATMKGGTIVLLKNIDIIHNHGGSSRINPVTTALTKSEVFISRHVYISEHNIGLNTQLIQTLLAVKSLLKTGIIALISVLLFAHPKAKASRLLFYRLTSYYYGVVMTNTWLSKRSRLYKK